MKTQVNDIVLICLTGYRFASKLCVNKYVVKSINSDGSINVQLLFSPKEEIKQIYSWVRARNEFGTPFSVAIF